MENTTILKVHDCVTHGGDDVHDKLRSPKAVSDMRHTYATKLICTRSEVNKHYHSDLDKRIQQSKKAAGAKLAPMHKHSPVVLLEADV